MKNIKKRIFEIIEAAKENDTASKIFDLFIIILIIINVILVIADTFSLSAQLKNIFNYIEVFSVVVFTIEYVLRVWTADFLYPSLTPFKACIRYIFSFMALVDLFAILPFYVPYLIPIDLRVLRMLRIIRLFRVFKINRYTNALISISIVFRKKKNQLFSSIFVVVLLMIIASVLMYNIEHEAQPEAFKNAFSALWWAVATLTTVGYGDVYPVTAFGKILSAVIALLGIGLVAVPTGIISAGFIENIEKEENENDEINYCPHCGKKIR